MSVVSVFVCILTSVAVSAHGGGLRNHTANAPAKSVQVGNAVARHAESSKSPAVLSNATAKMPVVAVHVSKPPRWQTKEQQRAQVAKEPQPAKLPNAVAGVVAGVLGDAAQQALRNKQSEDARKRLAQKQKVMDAAMRRDCEEEVGAARARHCETATGREALRNADAEPPAPPAPEPVGSSQTVPMVRIRAAKGRHPEPAGPDLIDEKEFRARVAQRFGSAESALKEADVDGDGLVSREELEKFMTDKLGLKPDEAKQLAETLLKKYDSDGDGKLTAKQLLDILDGLRKKGAATKPSTLAVLAFAILVRALCA